MMRLPAFRYRAPTRVEEVAAILAGEGPSAAVLAGGTDLFPNMKRRQQLPATVVSLRRVEAVRGVGNGRGLRIGAAERLSDLTRSPLVARHGALLAAISQIATPHLRATATLGGNLCLDTRCNYYDQTFEWREAIGFCMKKDGDVCWVAPSSPKCLAVSSTDGAPALMALDAEVSLASVAGSRRLKVAELYANDGIAYLTKRPDELLTEVHLPEQGGWSSTYWKLRRRGSIDFPVLGVAVAIRRDGPAVVDARIALGAVASRPMLVPDAAAKLLGKELTDEAIAAAAEACVPLAKPVDNTDFAIAWRKSVVKAFVTGALRQLRGDDPATFALLARRASLASTATVF